MDIFFGFACILAWLIFRWSMFQRDCPEALSSNDWFLAAAFILVFGGGTAELNFPLGCDEGFVLPHRFVRCNQSLRDRILDPVKGFVVGAPICQILGDALIDEFNGEEIETVLPTNWAITFQAWPALF